MTTTSRSRSPEDELRLLAIGDVHLGTRPGSLPPDLDEAGVDARSLTPEAALGAAVDLAIEQRVDAVLFAGDVVESTNARYEALRPLEAAVARLREAAIPVLSVVGNHDVEALPRLARMVDGIELLGEQGRWQSRVVERRGGPAVEILGWSFPQKQVRESPVASLLRDPLPPSRPGIARIGLLHADLDASGGHYAPVSRTELVAAGLDAWLLGHIHKPSLPDMGPDAIPTGAGAATAGPQGYLGSLVGLDPGETGAHGPWLVRVSADGAIATEHRPIAPLRWDRFEVRVGEDESAEDVADRLLDEAVHFARALHATDVRPKVLGLRPVLVGRTRHFDALRRRIDAGEWAGRLSRSVDDTFVFIDRVVDALELAHDLETLARGDDPPAILARKLLVLAREGVERDRLIESTRRMLEKTAADARWSVLADQRDARDPLSDAAILALLERSGRIALGELLSQGESGPQVDR